MTLPFMAGVQGVCVWARISAWPRHSWLGLVVRAFGARFRGHPAAPGTGPGCVCLVTRFSSVPPFLAGVCGVCVWVWAYPAPCYFWLGCSGVCPLARAPSMSCRPLVGLPVVWGCVGVAVGWVSPPLLLFCFGLPGCGWGVCGCGFPPCCVVACGGCRHLSRSWAPWSSHPLLWFGFCLYWFVPCGRWPATSPTGCAVSCPGCPFLMPFGDRAVVIGRCFWLRVAKLGAVVPRRSIGGPVGVALALSGWEGYQHLARRIL